MCDIPIAKSAACSDFKIRKEVGIKMRLYPGKAEHTYGLGSENVNESSWVSFLHGKNDI